MPKEIPNVVPKCWFVIPVGLALVNVVLWGTVRVLRRTKRVSGEQSLRS